MSAAPLRTWIPGPLPGDVRAALERLAATDGVARVAAMPDVHLAEEVCIGTVLGTRGRLFPGAIGGDIGCGVAAIRFDAEAAIIDDERAAARMLAGLYRRVPAVRHGRDGMPEMPAALAAAHFSDPRLEGVMRRDARVEFGTLGRGNHFLELQADEEGALWLLVHSGSRALGQAVARSHIERASGSAGGLPFIEADSEAGRAYLGDMEIALAYADGNRGAMIEAVVGLLDDLLGIEADRGSSIACVHNFVRRETHAGEDLWVHRKGAIPAAAGEAGIVPGSMGTASFHVEGRGCEDALCSSSHGAGRCMSRGEARRRVSEADLSRQMRGVWFDHRRMAALREEAPAAYKDVERVMRAQGELTRIVRKLRPILSYKGV